MITLGSYINHKRILNTPPVKDGSGKELRKLHDTIQQHLRALKSMEYDRSGPFLTSIIELKLDPTTLFEWQKHTQENTDVPHYQKILEFINLRARAAETSNPEPKKPFAINKSLRSLSQLTRKQELNQLLLTPPLLTRSNVLSANP